MRGTYESREEVNLFDLEETCIGRVKSESNLKDKAMTASNNVRSCATFRRRLKIAEALSLLVSSSGDVRLRQAAPIDATGRTVLSWSN